MARRFYRSGQFARKVSVSVRTLRYYDAVGLLAPTACTEAGYRLYTDDDLVRLQQILALKFLGFALDDIKDCLKTGPQGLQEALAAQKAMMREKRTQLNTVIRAIDAAERAARAGCATWEPLVHVMEVMQMDQQEHWRNKYFTSEQLRTMDALSESSYSEEARQKLAARSPQWTEQDQQRVNEQYAWIGAELKRLVAAGADPASDEAQAVAKLQHELLAAFTQGDPQIKAGLGKWWQSFGALPEGQRPFKPPYSGAEAEFLGKAMEVYKQGQDGS